MKYSREQNISFVAAKKRTVDKILIDEKLFIIDNYVFSSNIRKIKNNKKT
jgi:hypothetical protein